MNSNRTITTITGILYILAIVVGVLSIAPAVDNADYLTTASAHASQVILSAVFQLILMAIYVMIGIMLYPLLKLYNDRLALGFLSFRIIGAVFVVIGVVSLMLLLTLSREFVKIGSPDAALFQTLGKLLQTGRDLANHVGMIISLGISSFMLYSLLYKTQLVPRWLSGWGLAGTVLTIGASLLVMAGKLNVITTTYLLLNLPLALQEFIFAIWLVFKGFNANPTTANAG